MMESDVLNKRPLVYELHARWKSVSRCHQRSVQGRLRRAISTERMPGLLSQTRQEAQGRTPVEGMQNIGCSTIG